MRLGAAPRSSTHLIKPNGASSLEPKFYYLPTDEEEEEELSSVSQVTPQHPHNESIPISSIDENPPVTNRFEVHQVLQMRQWQQDQRSK